jgi:hypothetical protein
MLTFDMLIRTPGRMVFFWTVFFSQGTPLVLDRKKGFKTHGLAILDSLICPLDTSSVLIDYPWALVCDQDF